MSPTKYLRFEMGSCQINLLGETKKENQIPHIDGLEESGSGL